MASLKKAKRLRAAPLEFARLARLMDREGTLKMGGRWFAAGTFRAANSLEDAGNSPENLDENRRWTMG
jgi:hypothetical protein